VSQKVFSMGIKNAEFDADFKPVKRLQKSFYKKVISIKEYVAFIF
jgi:hypothetical protein